MRDGEALNRAVNGMGRRSWRRLHTDIRYLGVGLACAVANNVLLISFTTAGFGLVAATVVTLIPMYFLGYGLHVAVTFETGASLAAFLRYCVGITAGLPVWIVILYALVDVLKLPVAIAAPLGTVVMFLWNYALTHWAILGSLRACAGWLKPRL